MHLNFQDVTKSNCAPRKEMLVQSFMLLPEYSNERLYFKTFASLTTPLLDFPRQIMNLKSTSFLFWIPRWLFPIYLGNIANFRCPLLARQTIT